MSPAWQRRTGGAFVVAIALAAPASALSVTWSQRDIIDPIHEAPCRVQSLASSGASIYQSPEKYDQVFVPVTMEQGVWYCAGSGFASFIGDASLSAAEKTRIAGFLRLQPAPGTGAQAPDIAYRLQRAEAIYALRDLPPGRRALVHRILAYDFEALADDPARARLHRQAALKLMLERLAEDALPAGTRMEYLFVSANYLREAGDAARADRLFSQLEKLIAGSAGSPAEGYGQYLQPLLAPARSIAPGGRLAPGPVDPGAG